VTEIQAGIPVEIDFLADIVSSGNLQEFYVGCGSCSVQFTGETGNQFVSQFTFTVTVSVPADSTDTTWGVEAGAVDGAGQGGVECPTPGAASPARMTIPVRG
jgi:hypothetical protein